MQTDDYFIVYSADRNTLASTSSTDFEIDLKEGYQDIESVELIEAQIPNVSYVINSSNNKIDFSDPTVRSITITAGNYTANDLVSAIETALNASGTGLTFVCTYSLITSKITISAGANFSLLWDTGANTATNMAQELGFNDADNTLGTTFTSNNVVDLTSPNYYYINVKEFGGGFNTTGFDPNTFVIPNNVDKRELLVWEASENNDQKIIFSRHKAFKNLNIKLIARGINQTYSQVNQGSVVDLNGQNWSMILKFHFK